MEFSPKRIIVVIFTSIIRFIDLLVPKDENLLLFGSPRYYGNSRYLFEHTVLDKSTIAKEFNAVWMTRDTELVSKLNSQFGVNSAFKLTSLKGIIIFLRAKYLFFSHGASDFYYYVGKSNPKKVIINLWHGTPIKKMDGLVKGTKMRWDYMTAGSQYEKTSYRNISKIDFADIIITGHPRNEYLYKKLKDKELIEELKSKHVHKNIDVSQIALYAPTYRHHASTELFPFEDYDFTKLHSFLKENGILLIIRFHPNDLGPIEDKKYRDLLSSKFIIDGSIEQYPSMQDFLLISDFLITDYSSSYYDFLITKRPTIFIPYDKEKYDELYGFSLDYDNLIENLKVETFDHFLTKVKEITTGNKAIKKKLIEDFNKFHQYDLNRTCEMILKEVTSQS